MSSVSARSRLRRIAGQRTGAVSAARVFRCATGAASGLSARTAIRGRIHFLSGLFTAAPTICRTVCPGARTACIAPAAHAIVAAFWLLLPDHYFAALAAVIAVEALILHCYLQLVGVGSFWQGPVTRQLEEFRFVRVEKDFAKLKPLYDLFIKELTPALKEGDRLHDKPHEEIVQMKMQSDQKKWKYVTFYAAYHGDKLVGTVTCQFDSNERQLPVEYITSRPMNLDKMREYGPLAEFGRLSVAEDYRMAPEVLGGLIMCATETALAHDACFIVLQAVAKTARIYSKMGFAPILEESVTNLEYGTPMKLFATNLATQAGARNAYRDNMGHLFSPYIMHRFVWRQIVKIMLRAHTQQKRVSDLSTQELTAMAEFR